MIITLTKLMEITGLKRGYLSYRFKHIQEDVIHYGNSQYDVDKLINEINVQLLKKSNSQNQTVFIQYKEKLQRIKKLLEKLKEL